MTGFFDLLTERIVAVRAAMTEFLLPAHAALTELVSNLEVNSAWPARTPFLRQLKPRRDSSRNNSTPMGIM